MYKGGEQIKSSCVYLDDILFLDKTVRLRERGITNTGRVKNSCWGEYVTSDEMK